MHKIEPMVEGPHMDMTESAAEAAERTKSAASTNWLIALITGGVAVVLGALMALPITRSITRPPLGAGTDVFDVGVDVSASVGMTAVDPQKVTLLEDGDLADF